MNTFLTINSLQRFLFFFVLITFFTSCFRGNKQEFANVSEFSEYVNGYSGGIISAHSPIVIEFVADIPEEKRTQKHKNLFKFVPAVKGEYEWISANTIAFFPEKPLSQNTNYQVDFEIGRLLDLEERLRIFHFEFTTIKQQMDMVISGLKPEDLENPIQQVLEFTVNTADRSDSIGVLKSIQAIADGQNLKIKYLTGTDNSHKLEIHNIVRQDKSYKLNLNWDASFISGEGKGDVSIRIPSKSEFTVTSARVIEGQDTYIEVRFSDPISPTQDLEGLIYIEASDEPISLLYEAFLVKVYLRELPQNNIKLVVSNGVKSILGYYLNEQFEVILEIGGTIPSVNFVGHGSIVPGRNQAFIPLEITGLKAIDIKVMKIPEHNVFQFLQVNPLNGANELIRVARTISQKTYVLPFKNLSDLKQKKTYTLDLNKLVDTEPGAIYRIEISFRKEYAVLDCIQNNEQRPITRTKTRKSSNPDAPDFYGGYYLSYYGDSFYDDDYWYEYDWRERDNPCHSSFYNSSKNIARNILSSSIGLLAKRGSGNKILVAANDINSTQPLGGINIEIYNYQKQIIGKAITDNTGLCEVEIKNGEFAFMIIATKGVEKGYLRIDNGNSLPNSMFDITGEVVQEGIKGFIYTERGVWRPGDSIYVSFIMQDAHTNLPQGAPVIMELNDPLGNLVDRQLQTFSNSPILTYITKTQESAITGNYRLNIKVGGAEFSKSLKVENIRPNRLKIFIEHQDKYLAAFKKNNLQIRSEWLTGLKAPGLRAIMEMKLYKTSTQFSKFPNYNFDDLSKTFYSDEEILFDGNLDKDGVAKVNTDINTQDAPGMLNLQLTTRVFEDGGAFSIDAYTVPFHPFRNYVGVKVPLKNTSGFEILETDRPHKFDFVSVDFEGRSIPNRKLRVSLYKLEYKWWWESFEYGLSYYTENNSRYEIYSEHVVTGKDGKASLNLNVDSKDWGRYFVKVCDEEGGHCAGTTVYFDWPDWYSRGDETSRKQAAILNVNTNKDEYDVGETIQLSFQGTETARAFITLENGSGIIDKQWVSLKSGENVINFKATKSMLPNVYFNVTVLQPHRTKANDLPLRLYGIKGVEVKDPTTLLNPIIETSDKFVPGKLAKIKVKEKDGKPLTYTLAVVDEGLLDLTRFKTPNPHRYFYSPEALGVYSWDLYDWVVGNHTLQAGRIITVGGDGEIDKKAASKVRRFKPLVRFFGPISIARGSSKEHVFTVPEYYGSVRIMLIAVSDKSYGNAEKTVKVSKPVMVYATAPRVLSINEKITIPVSVIAMEAEQKTANVSISTKGLKINGNKTKTVNLKEGGETNAFFELETGDRAGFAQIVVTAKAGNNEAKYTIDIEVRNPNPLETQVQTKILKAGEEAQLSGNTFGVPGSNSATLEISAFPGVRVQDRLEYLLEYPYGCVEQITSAGFAQIFVPKIIELKESEKTKIKENIAATLQTLTSLQNSEGAIPYWRNTSIFNEWTEVYVLHFALAAKANGYFNAETLISKSKSYQTAKAKRFSNPSNKNFESEILTQSYRLYVLALSGSPESGAMNRLRESPALNSTSIYLLSAAYSLAGQQKAANELLLRAGNVPVDKNYPYTATLGNELRDQAIALIALSQSKNEKESELYAQKLANRLNSDGVLSTQSSAFALFALSSYLSGKTNEPKKVEVSINDKITEKIQFQNYGFSKTLKAEGENSLRIKNAGNSEVVVSVIKKGIPAPGNETPRTSTLKVSRTFSDINGKPIKPEKITQGTDLRMTISVTNSGAAGNLEKVALNQLFPSGWEILNERLFYSQDFGLKSEFLHQDIKDDRVYTFFNLKSGETKTFTFKLNAAYLGEFYIPATLVEVMYQPEISTLIKGQKTEVVR